MHLFLPTIFVNCAENKDSQTFNDLGLMNNAVYLNYNVALAANN